MPKKLDSFDKSQLMELRVVALKNARELLSEAQLLVENGHYARGYFLGVACIEEVGKANSAASAAGRDLANIKIRRKVQDELAS